MDPIPEAQGVDVIMNNVDINLVERVGLIVEKENGKGLRSSQVVRTPKMISKSLR